eukprot:gnl/TRDRNA2_/TRDRNA2_85476_c0_seq1.p1 gnl/TRDRNA2_/TRDRNA2_85476_c0~~gnl/TRDRNA2_/TRDRNA2_85476_c0_seq1.p1  ORF type:complete len:405 (+),score=99.35 gnl/TRDRNA2_/TRDRNA2_85476_c0_seq1:60-1217(+)
MALRLFGVICVAALTVSVFVEAAAGSGEKASKKAKAASKKAAAPEKPVAASPSADVRQDTAAAAETAPEQPAAASTVKAAAEPTPPKAAAAAAPLTEAAGTDASTAEELEAMYREYLAKLKERDASGKPHEFVKPPQLNKYGLETNLFGEPFQEGDPHPRWRRVRKTENLKPFVTTELVYGTFELLYDAYEALWDHLIEDMIVRYDNAFVVKRILVVAWPDDIILVAAEVLGVEKKELLNRIAHAQALVAEKKVWVHAKMVAAYDPMNQLAIYWIRQFERAMPDYKGVIPQNLGDFTVFISYVAFILYVVLRIVRCMLRWARKIFCILCCCRCLRVRRKEKKTRTSMGGSKAPGRRSVDGPGRREAGKDGKAGRSESKPAREKAE